jgi:hypothetical protein
VQAAVKFVIFTANQIDVLYTEFSDRTALAPNLAKILTLAEAKGGSVSARMSLRHSTQNIAPTSRQIQEWFTELIEMKYGEVQQKAKKLHLPSLHTPQYPQLLKTLTQRATHISTLPSPQYPQYPHF